MHVLSHRNTNIDITNVFCIFESFKGDLFCFVGLSGLLPLHPQTYMEAARNRKAAEEKARKVDEEKVNDDQESTETAEDTR